MKILIITNSISTGNLSGGVEVVAKLHHRALREIGFVCDLIAMNRSTNLNTSFFFAENPLPKARRVLWSERLGHFSFKFVAMFFREFRYYDVIHIHLCKDFATVTALIISRLARKKIIVQTHGMFFRNDRKIDRVFNLICKKFTNQVDGHLILTDSETQWFENNGWHAKRLKIRNPVVMPMNLVSEKSYTYDVCFLSRFHARKRPLMLIEAIKLLTELGLNPKVRMAGSDEGELSSCQEKIREYALEHLIDISDQISEEEISQVLMASKTMVLPSYAEFVPMIILESLAHAVPVIAGRDCELAQELNRINTCLLADDPIELAQCIAELITIDTRRNALVKAGHDWVRQNCDFTEVGLTLTRIYSHIMTQEDSP